MLTLTTSFRRKNHSCVEENIDEKLFTETFDFTRTYHLSLGSVDVEVSEHTVGESEKFSPEIRRGGEAHTKQTLWINQILSC